MLAPGGDESKRPDIVNNSWGQKANEKTWFNDILKNGRKLEFLLYLLVAMRSLARLKQALLIILHL